MRFLPTRFFAAACAVAAVITIHGCGSRTSQPSHPATISVGEPLMPSRRTADYLRVEAATIARSGNTRSLVARVSFDERHLARIGPPVQGRIANITVVAGDRVTQGQVLATIHAPDIAAANAEVLRTRSSVLLTQLNAVRARALVGQGAGSVADAQQAETALIQSRTEEARALAARAALGGAHGLSDYELHSPIAGTVVERNVNIGAEVHVGQDQPMITVAELATVWVLADVYEQDLALIHLNDSATVDVIAYPGRAFTGRITSIGDTVDPQTRVARARIEIVNTDLALRPGMFAHVEVHEQTQQGGAEVPLSAVLARRDQFFVFVRDDNGSYSRREVQRGQQHGQHVTILAGLRPGENVVTEGAILLDAEANSAI